MARILIAEDEDGDRELLTRALVHVGYEVTAAKVCVALERASSLTS